MQVTKETQKPTRREVREALLWALENDRGALLEHRETSHYRRWDAPGANARIVGKWRSSRTGQRCTDVTAHRESA